MEFARTQLQLYSMVAWLKRLDLAADRFHRHEKYEQGKQAEGLFKMQAAADDGDKASRGLSLAVPVEIVEVFPQLEGLSAFRYDGRPHYSKPEFNELLKRVTRIGFDTMGDIRRNRARISEGIGRIDDFFKSVGHSRQQCRCCLKMESEGQASSTAMDNADQRRKQYRDLKARVERIKRASEVVLDPVCYSHKFEGGEYVDVEPLPG